VALFADTFNTYFEPENLEAAMAVLAAAGYRVTVLTPPAGGRPLCCGRSFLTAGLVDEARKEARRLIAAALPLVKRGVPVVGLEPSCIFTLRDELAAMLPGEDAAALAAHGLLFEEFLAREAEAGRLDLRLRPIGARAWLHGHCHQKAFGVMGAVERALKLVPDLEVKTIASSSASSKARTCRPGARWTSSAFPEQPSIAGMIGICRAAPRRLRIAVPGHHVSGTASLSRYARRSRTWP
jgi:Fe-S oxidoreductase